MTHNPDSKIFVATTVSTTFNLLEDARIVTGKLSLLIQSDTADDNGKTLTENCTRLYAAEGNVPLATKDWDKLFTLAAAFNKPDMLVWIESRAPFISGANISRALHATFEEGQDNRAAAHVLMQMAPDIVDADKLMLAAGINGAAGVFEEIGLWSTRIGIEQVSKVAYTLANKESLFAVTKAQQGGADDISFEPKEKNTAQNGLGFTMPDEDFVRGEKQATAKTSAAHPPHIDFAIKTAYEKARLKGASASEAKSICTQYLKNNYLPGVMACYAHLIGRKRLKDTPDFKMADIALLALKHGRIDFVRKMARDKYPNLCKPSKNMSKHAPLLQLDPAALKFYMNLSMDKIDPSPIPLAEKKHVYVLSMRIAAQHFRVQGF